MSQMDVAFIIRDMTELRHLIPFSKRLKECMPEARQCAQVAVGDATSPKYNSIVWDDHFALLESIIKRHAPWLVQADRSKTFDVIVQVEAGELLQCKKRISIQHGFDFLFQPGERGKYVCSTATSADMARKMGIDAIAAPFPVALWDHDGTRRTTPRPNDAFVLYPDQGDREEADRVIASLHLGSGHNVWVKQRRKHQEMTVQQDLKSPFIRHVFDEAWYPSEAIEGPMSCGVTVGFGSSAYNDLVPLGVPYWNIDLHPDDPRWSSFPHPTMANYTHEQPSVRGSGFACIPQFLSSDPIKRRHVDVGRVHGFIRSLMGVS